VLYATGSTKISELSQTSAISGPVSSDPVNKLNEQHDVAFSGRSKEYPLTAG